MEFAMVVGVCWYAQFGCEWSGGPLVVLDIMWVLYFVQVAGAFTGDDTVAPVWWGQATCDSAQRASHVNQRTCTPYMLVCTPQH